MDLIQTQSLSAIEAQPGFIRLAFCSARPNRVAQMEFQPGVRLKLAGNGFCELERKTSEAETA